MNHRSFIFAVCSLLLFAALTACSPAASETPTPSMNLTQTYQTVIAQVTEIALLTGTPPPASPFPTESGLPTLTPTPADATPTGIPTAIASTFTPTSPADTCDRAEAGLPIDVTIPDDTPFAPGATFVKTWRLVNVGTCTWNSSYALVFVSGEKMGGQDALPLTGSVAPGQSVDLSVSLTAPSTPGTYQGNWMLRNPAGALFGIGPQANGFFWVRIVVTGVTATPTVTQTPAESPTPTVLAATATPTPAIFFTGSFSTQPDSLLDLDTGAVNSGAGNDLSFTTDQNNNHPLTPQGSAAIGVFGAAQPGKSDCESASLSSAPLAVESLSAGAYLCFRTDQGRYGWLRMDSFDAYDFTLAVTLLTWEP